MASMDLEQLDDWEERVPCSDGSCIGTIGADGLCRECGVPHSDGVIPRVLDEPQDDESSADPPDESEEPVEPPDDPTSDVEDDWESRQLCSDGNCIGIIGADGVCTECGAPP